MIQYKSKLMIITAEITGLKMDRTIRKIIMLQEINPGIISRRLFNLEFSSIYPLLGLSCARGQI